MFNIIWAHPNSLQIAYLCMVYDGTTLVILRSRLTSPLCSSIRHSG